MRYLAALVMSLSLASCGIISSTPVLNDVLASNGDTRPFETPLPVNTAHKKLALGYTTSVGVKEDGTVWSWGYDTHGSLGNGRESSKQLKPMQLNGMTDFIEVAGNDGHFLALRRDGTVWSWGNNEYGQLGYKTDKKFSSVPQQVVGLNNIISVATGAKYSLALDKQGTVYISGINERWGVNVDKTTLIYTTPPKPLISQTEVVKIITYGADAALMAKDGQLWLCCDRQLEGLRFRKISQKVVDIAFSFGATYYLLPNGFVMAEGQNISGELGQGDYKSYMGFVQIKNIGRIKSITGTGASGIALDEKGKIWQWGYNVRYPVIAGVQHNVEPQPILVGIFPNAVSLQGGGANSVLLENGQVYFWGWNRGGLRGTGKALSSKQISSKDWFVPEISLWTWK